MIPAGDVSRRLKTKPRLTSWAGRKRSHDLRRGLVGESMLARIMLLIIVVLTPLPAFGQANPKEEDYYVIQPYTMPKGEVLEVGGLEWLPDGKLALSTRRGEIWLVENPLAKDIA